MGVGDGSVSTGGFELHLTNSSAVLTKLVGLKSLNDPDVAFDKVETTDQDSGGIKRYKPGMGDMPDLVATIGHEPGSPTHALILEHKASKETRPCKLVIPEEDGTDQESSGSLFILSYVPNDGSLGSERTAVLTCSITPVTRADAA